MHDFLKNKLMSGRGAISNSAYCTKDFSSKLAIRQKQGFNCCTQENWNKDKKHTK